MTQHREAATVLLLRGEGRGLEVYLGERSTELRFFGGYHALPGGVRGPEDDEDGQTDEDALRRCAVRELFEETGVLLLTGARPAADERSSIRRALLDGEQTPWRELRTAAAGTVDVTRICRIETPPFAPVRYDTVFFAAHLPVGEEPEIWPGELVGGRFWRPGEALEAWRRGEVLIVPPVLILLQLMVDRELPEFMAAAARIAEGYERGDLHRVRFSPGVIMASLATPTLPPATTTNCLIVGEHRLYVIDPAAPDEREQQRLFDLLDALCDEGREIEAVLLTHHHPDHVAAAPAVSRRYDVEVRGHHLTLSRIEAGQPGPPLNDGDRLPLGEAPDGTLDWHLEALFTPGHDRGHLCFRESRYGALIAGDMLSTVSTIVIDPPEGHMQTYLESLNRLAETPMTTLYPAHGPAYRDGPALVQRYIRHRRDRQQKVVDALRRGPATVEQLVPAVYDDVDARMYPWAERSLLAGLQMLQENGEAGETAGLWTHRADS